MKPTLVDLSIMNLPQLYQGQEPACDAFDISKYVMLLIYIKTGKITNISPRWIYANCVRPGIVGLYTADVLDFGMKVGFCTSDLIDEDITLPESEYRVLTVTPAMTAAAAQYKIGGFVAIQPDLDSVYTALAAYKAVIASIPVGNFNTQPVQPPVGNNSLGLHAALIYGMAPVGTADEIILWDNWWGITWGNQGYGVFLWSQFQSVIQQIYAITSIIISPMQPTVQPSTLSLIEGFEQFSASPYQDEGGVWTIGYGATYDLSGNPVTASTAPVTQEQAAQLLQVQVVPRAQAVVSAIKVPLNQNQFDACVSLCYNIGISGFTNSTVARMCNANNFSAAAQAFLMWKLVNGKVSAGLMNRREKEMTLFNTPVAV